MLLMFGVFAAAAACASDGKSGERAHRATDAYSRPGGSGGAPTGQQVSTTAIPREVRHAVVADAAKRFNVAESAVVLTRAEQVTWPDGSLGCPQPGRMYTQMLVAGFRVAAKTTEGELTYHTDARGNIVSCASGMAGQRPVDAVRKPSNHAPARLPRHPIARNLCGDSPQAPGRPRARSRPGFAPYKRSESCNSSCVD